MTIVLDASVVVAALIDTGDTGVWAETQLASAPLFSVELLPFKVANVLRRLALAGDISEDVATLAHQDLLSLPIELIGYDALAARVWELRPNLTAYDAGYVAAAEMLAVPLATIDHRIVRAPSTRCDFVSP